MAVRTDRRRTQGPSPRAKALVYGSFLSFSDDRDSTSSTERRPTVNEASTLRIAPSPLSCSLDALETKAQYVDTTCPVGMDEPPSDAGVSFRHSGWSGNRQCVDAALDGLSDGSDRLARFRSCGCNGWVMQSIEDPRRYRVKCDKCRDRFCTPCATERARLVASCVKEFSHGRELRFITLTLRKSDRSLAEDVSRLYNGFAKLRRRRLWSKSQKGGIAFIEIKRRRGDDGWHVHLHAISEGRDVCQDKLSVAWHQITGDSFIVHVRWCDSDDRAAFYAAKYAGKGIHGSCYHDADVLREAIVALKGRRLIAKWGTWRELDLETNEEPGAWIAVDSLAHLIHRKNAGDVVAGEILASLSGEKTCNTARSPPAECGECQFNFGTLRSVPDVRRSCKA